MRKIREKNKAIFWDYDTGKMDLNNPEVKAWYLSRKLSFGDFSGISKRDLRKYFIKLNINASLRELLKNYLKKNVKHKTY